MIIMQKTVTIPKEEYLRLKQQAGIDMELLKALCSSLADIKAGRIKQVR